MKIRLRIPVEMTTDVGVPSSLARWGKDSVDLTIEVADMTQLQRKLDMIGECLAELLNNESDAVNDLQTEQTDDHV